MTEDREQRAGKMDENIDKKVDEKMLKIVLKYYGEKYTKRCW